MSRVSFRQTYEEIKQARRIDWLPKPEMKVMPEIVDYANRHGKRETYLYNNRLFNKGNALGIGREQYDVNWNWINKLK